MKIILLRAICLAAIISGLAGRAALGDDFFPHPANARWKCFWKDSTYNPSGTTETVKIDTTDRVTCGWQLQWSGTINVPFSSGPGPTIPQPTTAPCASRTRASGS